MAESVRERPFGEFKLGIKDPRYFFGRQQLIDEICRSPFRVRVLVGGRRLGKTSTLFALRHSVSRKRKPNDPHFNPSYRRVLMILVRLNLVAPRNLNNFFYILISCCQEGLV